VTRLRQLAWFEPVRGATEEEIRAAESNVGVRFPDDYREFLADADGGMPVESDFALNDPERRDAAVGTFLAVSGGDVSGGDDIYRLPDAAKILSGRLPRGVVPIAIGPGGDFVALDYRAGAEPTIVYWHHEREGSSDDITPVAATFSAFLEMLFAPDLENE
jgi:hypothetical protein